MTTAAEDRTLILVRHAEAKVPRPGGGDHGRRLTKDGQRDAREAGRWLREIGWGVDEVLCSTATRAVETAECLWDGGCAETEVHHDDRLYNAGPQQILEVVREADPDADVVMVVGHAPGVPMLASLLADGEGSDEAHRALAAGCPTTGIAVLHYRGPWADLAFGAAALDRFHIARAVAH